MEAAALTRNSRLGDRVAWTTVVGVRYEGTLIEWDSNVAIILLDDDTTKAVEC